MSKHTLSFCQDFDPDGFMVVCPAWMWPINIISEGDPVHCPMCGVRLPAASASEVKGDNQS